MRIFLKWIITLGSIFTIMISKELGFEQFIKWEFMTVAIISVLVWLYFIWRRRMRLEQTTICIQFLDD